MKQTFILDMDDLEAGKPGIELVYRLKEHYPNLKVSLFMVPIPRQVLTGQIKPTQYQKWIDNIKKEKWIEILPHGVTHQPYEMMYRTTQKGYEVLLDYDNANLYLDAMEHTFKQLGLPNKKIFKSPHWETSPDAYKALWDRGYTIAVDPNQEYPKDGKVYLYNWSIDEPIPIEKLVKGHGHLSGVMKNTLNLCLNSIYKIPSDAKFKFVSEVI